MSIVKLFLKYWWIVLMIIALSVSSFFAGGHFLNNEKIKQQEDVDSEVESAKIEEYISNASIYVDNNVTEAISPDEIQNNTANLYDLTTSEMLVDTYIEILSSKGFFELIKEKTDIQYTAEQMKNMVTYARVEETGVIHINVTAPTPEDAYYICGSILEHANTQIANIMEVGSIKIIKEATMPEET